MCFLPAKSAGKKVCARLRESAVKNKYKILHARRRLSGGRFILSNKFDNVNHER